MYGNHTLCTPECPAKKAKENGEEYIPKVSHLCPKMHSDIRQDLEAVVSMFTTMERLEELFHDGEDIVDRGTQPNEAVNNGTCTMAPKAINYSTSTSFHDRVHHMIGVHNYGHVAFFDIVFSKLGVPLDAHLREYLKNMCKKKERNREYCAKQSSKKKERRVMQTSIWRQDRLFRGSTPVIVALI
mmetsp:Transcript_39552/g.57756  ORF Transcript_39552/g.57756 Transcript_39552/m.57756 type:complete len:185 (+) Transcript_39552:1039-1593(+)